MAAPSSHLSGYLPGQHLKFWVTLPLVKFMSSWQSDLAHFVVLLQIAQWLDRPAGHCVCKPTGYPQALGTVP